MVSITERLVRGAIDDEFVARPMTESGRPPSPRRRTVAPQHARGRGRVSGTRGPNGAGAWGSHYGTLALAATPATAQTIMRRAMVES